MMGKGIVVDLNGDRATVRVSQGTECMGCPSRMHCHGGEQKPRDIVVINDRSARVSDHVAFEAASGKVILSAALIWILPLLSMIIGYIVAGRFTHGFWAILVAFLFLAGSFLVLRFIDSAVTGGSTFYPKITRILSTPESEETFCGEHRS